MKKTFNECINLFLQRNTLKKSTIKSYQSIYDMHLKKILGNKKVSKIQSKDLGLLTQNIKSYSRNYQIKILTFLKSVLKWSDKRLATKSKVIDSIEIGKRQKRHFYKIIEPKEFARFINVIDKMDYKIFFLTLYLTGARKGEVQGLKWQDINFNKSIITITKQWNNKANELSQPKTDSAIRQIFIPQTLVKALNELKRGQESKNENFVFGGNKHFSATQIDRVKNYYCELAQINKFTIHTLRHSYASLLINLNADITIVAKLLGHSDIEQTLNTYAHMFPSQQIQTIYKLEQKIKSEMN